jgi:KDO2-lipid IV(A) lauroyltransferase
VRDRLTLWAYVAGWALVKALPERLARRLFDAGADLAYRRQGKGVRRLEANLRRILPPGADLAATTRAGVRSYARYWLEAFRLPILGRERILAGVTCDDADRLHNAKGVVAVLPHMGNWDVAGAWASLAGAKFTTVAERLRPEGLFDRFVAFRESLGMEVIPLTGGDANPFDLLADRLRAGGLVCLLGDRDLTARGVEVTFFGETAKFPAGPAALAVRTGAALTPATLWFEGDGWHVRMHPPIEVPPGPDRIARMTQAVADVFEQGIREHPEDWHMLQRLWLADLEPRVP